MATPPPELVVLSLEAAERCEPLGEEVCISITDPGAAPARLSPRFAAVPRLHFNDVAEAGAPTTHRRQSSVISEGRRPAA